jgi:hypothetical protein
MSGAALSSALMDALQREAFDYFVYEANPLNGLIADKTEPGWPASIARPAVVPPAFAAGSTLSFRTPDGVAKHPLTMAAQNIFTATPSVVFM